MPSATSTVRRSLLPPDEQFWQRYSPHHEFRLSSAASIALHALVLALLALIGWSLARLATAQHPALADVPVVVTPGGSSGALDGDGNPVGGPRIGPDAEDTGPKPDQAKAVIKPPRINEPRIAPPVTTPADNKEEL